MKRRFFALACAFILVLSLSTSAVAATPDPGAVSADTLHTLGLLNNPASGYDLTAAPSRVTGVTLLVRLAGSQTTATSAGFTDVPDWAEDTVNYAYQQGWISGTSETTFGSYSPLTTNAFCAMVLRMLGYDDGAGDFEVSSAALFAQRLGVLRHDVVPSGDLTVGDLCTISLDLLSVCYRDSEETILDRLLATQGVYSYAANALGLTDPALTARQVSDRYQAAVFTLDCYYNDDSYAKGDSDANASGFFISQDGLAITNYHSIESCTHAVGTLSTGEQLEVERVLYYDVDIDVAVIQVTKPTEDALFAYFDIQPRSTLEAGDICYAMSNPLGLGLSISSGVISTLSSFAAGYALPCIVNDASISKGSSGGALVNQYGDAIGITAGAYTYGNNMYLAVPLDPVLEADLTGNGWTLPQLVEIEDSAWED